MINGKEKTYRRGYTMKEYTPWAKHTHGNEKVYNDIMTEYVNSADLRHALHIPDEVQAWE
jgi:hypothetical protein